MTATEVVDWFDAKKCGKNNKFVNVDNEGEGEGEDKKPIIEYKKDTIENAINTIIINKLSAEQKNIEDIALNVISNYRSKLLEHMQTAIIKEITKDLEEKLKTIDDETIDGENITKKIVNANVKNFKDLLSGHADKTLTNAYKDLLDFANICKAKKAAEEEAAEKEAAEKEEKKKKKRGGKPKRKKYTRKSHNKPNKQKTRRFKGVKGGENDDEKCLNVRAICGKVTSIIYSQANKFETETVNDSELKTKLKTKLETVCLKKTNEILDDFSKQAIDISSLDDIFKMLIFEITNIVTSNMKKLDETFCK